MLNQPALKIHLNSNSYMLLVKLGYISYVRFEFLVVLSKIVFWDVMLCSLVDIQGVNK
jgi:hypothetical protein